MLIKDQVNMTVDKVMQNYAINDQILKSSGNYDTRNISWRQQNVVVQHLTRNTCASVQHTALHELAKKISYEDEISFLQQRANAVDVLLCDYSSQLETPSVCWKNVQLEELTSHQFSVEFKDIESDCRSYHSCRHVEMTDSKFQPLRSSEKNFVTFSTGRVGQASFTQQQASKWTTIGKKTLRAYLKPKDPPTNSKICGSEDLGTKDQYVSNKTQLQQLTPTDSDKYASLRFRTAREELILRHTKKQNDNGNNYATLFNYGKTKKTLLARRTVYSSFVPVRKEGSVESTFPHQPVTISSVNSTSVVQQTSEDECLKNIDPKMVELICNEIIHKNQSVDWDDIAGLDYAKSIIKEAVVYPLLRPDIFSGLRRPPRGILLFGPPGTGKTLIGKCIASMSQSTFFSISASSLTSKWVGDGEKMVRALFAVAAVYQPSVVFIDEIDSLLTQRSEGDQESSRRLKTEFLVQLDGAATSKDDRILIVGATNRPQELDEAARRRLVRRLYIPLPELKARIQILTNLLQTVSNSLTIEEIGEIGHLTDGYSGADMESLCREASMEPIRNIPPDQITYFKVEKVRPINMQDFTVAVQSVRPSVSQNDLNQYTEWNRIYGAIN